LRLNYCGAAVDRDGLAGDKIAVSGCQKHQRAEQILRIFVALERAARNRGLARMVEMPGFSSITLSLSVNPAPDC